MKPQTACIVGAGEIAENELLIPEDALIIAADGGLEALEKAGVKADLIVGDFDSLGRVPEGDNVIRTPAEKDDTDMLLAVRLALQKGATQLLLFGGMGGRFDHSIANIQTLVFIANNGARGFLFGGGSVCAVIKNGSLEFSPEYSGYVSVFAVGDRAIGVDLKGLKYPLTNHTLECDFPLGVSNEFTGCPSSVSVRDGSLLVIWNTSPGEKLPE